MMKDIDSQSFELILVWKIYPGNEKEHHSGVCTFRFVSFRFMSLLVSLIAPLLVSFIPTDWNNKFFGIYRRPNRLVCRCNSSQCPRVVENEYRDNP